MVGKILRAEVRGKSKWRWMDGMKEILSGRNLSLEEGMFASGKCKCDSEKDK